VKSHVLSGTESLSAQTKEPAAHEIPAPMCFAQLFRMAFDGEDPTPLRNRIVARPRSGSVETAADLMSLCTIYQLLGDQKAGLACQAEALGLHLLYRSSWPASPAALRVLAFKAAGDFSTNTPIEFLLEGRDVVLYSLYVLPGRSIPRLPEHDIAIVTAGESDRDRPVLELMERLIRTSPCPVLNRPDRVLRLSREGMWRLLRAQGPCGARTPACRVETRLDACPVAHLPGRTPACSSNDIPGLLMPETVRMSRTDIQSHTRFPIIARPVDSHAGRGLTKFETAEAVDVYLAGRPDAEFFVSPYIDYRSLDGQFRKYRIVWVDGRPYPCHMAIADRWDVWYYNAGMAVSAGKRSEEEHFITTFDTGFACRHAPALAAIAERLGLEYVGIDCAELPGGRLLVFEGDISLVVHNLDPPDLYPYKSRPMKAIFAAFHDMLKRRSG